VKAKFHMQTAETILNGKGTILQVHVDDIIYRPLIFVELLTCLTVGQRVAAAAGVRRRRFGGDAPRPLLLAADLDC